MASYKIMFPIAIAMVAMSWQSQAADEGDDNTPPQSEHHLSLSLGVATAKSRTMEKFSRNYLDATPNAMNLFALKYHHAEESDKSETAGLKASLFRASSTQTKSYDFGTLRLYNKLFGATVGWGIRYRLLCPTCYVIASGEVGLTQQDITIATPSGDITYEDFGAQTTFDSVALKFEVGGRWDFWNKAGTRLGFELMQLINGDRFLIWSLGVGYGF